MRVYLLSFFFLFIFSSSRSQTSRIKKAQQSFDKAQKQLNSEDYGLAIRDLETAIKADPKFQFAYLQLAEIHRKVNAFEKAKLCYTTAINISPFPEPIFYYGFGEANLNTGDYSNAKLNYLKFVESYNNKDKTLLIKAKKLIEDCNFSLSATKNPEQFQLVNIGQAINSVYREYLPTLTADANTMIFSRNVDGNEDFYISEKKNNEWQTAKSLSNAINTKLYNEGAQSLSPDGRYLFFTGCNRRDGLGRCDIYVSRRNGKDWDVPFNLGPSVNSFFWESQPAISADGNTLYFVSNRPGGFGGYDLWNSVLDDEGNWSAPKNLGPEINTPYDEITPFIYPDGKTLYFSSDGWPGMGNKDLFYSRMDENKKWNKPVNLGFPMNTYNEETGLTVMPNGLEGLISSNIKTGFGNMDIYYFQMPEHARPQPITYIKGLVKGKETQKLLEAKIKLVDLKTNKTIYNGYTTGESGQFLSAVPLGSNYSLHVNADDYLFYSEKFELNTAHIEKPYVLEIFLEKIKIGTNVILRNIFFETSKYNLLPGSVTELNSLIDLMTTHKNVHIEIQGHTDNIGNDLKNEQLSLDRAQAVYNYLITHEVDLSRLSYKGFGDKKPLASNDTEQGRRQNRRTSFIITKT